MTDTPPPQPGRAEPWVVVVALVLPMAVGGVTDRLGPFVGGELGHIAQAVGWVTLLGYLARRSGEPPVAFGFARPDWLTDTCTALLLVPVLWWTSSWAVGVCEWAGLPAAKSRYPLPSRDWHWGLLAIGLLASAFAEEVLYRGYLQTRLRRLTGSGVAAWLTVAGLFGAAHSYHGPQGPVVSGLSGLVFGAAFAVTGRLWGVTLGHAGYNLLVTAMAGEAHPLQRVGFGGSA